ncbi:MAG: GYDIA family GHMP kinase [Bacteroidota bacterium]
MNSLTHSLHKHGKLLLTGEYFVLDGALALAVPTQLGQRFTFEVDPAAANAVFSWKSVDVQGNTWFRGLFHREDLTLLNSIAEPVGLRLMKIFNTIKRMNPNFVGFQSIENITSNLEFPNEWGLGTSSTLIAALAEWADVSAYELLQETFGGSGYDLACANAERSILYQIHQGAGQYVEIPYMPPYQEGLYFIYLGKKQNSRAGIQRFRAKGQAPKSILNKINQLSLAWLQAADLQMLDQIILQHEAIVSGYLGLEKVKDLYFQNYWGAVKSLGAWGGDFVLATSNRSPEETKGYFQQKGFNTIFSYQDLIFAQPNS